MENLNSLTNKELIQLYRLILEHQESLKTDMEKVEKEEEQ